MKQEEKILLLGSLFHDVGKFEQRVLTKHIPHSELGTIFFNTLKSELIKILGDETAFERAKKMISEHHTTNFKEILVGFTKQADHLSASERVGFDKEDDWKDTWSHKFMTSLFSKIYLNNHNSDTRKMKYYSHQLLTKKNYKILIPQYETEKDIKETKANYAEDTFEKFTNNIRSILSFYETENDFNTVINLLLIVFEKYMWCIPDFTGSENTDISLFNHLKDVAGLSHAIFKSQDTDSNNLNLIIGDIPGIQKYIFNVANKRPAKILRGRSIFVQILTRQFASIILEKLDLTDASLIMLAGGKFYIIAHSSIDFDVKFNEAKEDIESILIKNFNYQLSFSSVAHKFNFENLKNKNITFGDIIDEASYKLLLKRNQQFENVLFAKNDFDKFDFILNDRYIEPDNGSSSNSIKCAVTDLPIRENHIGWMRDGKEQDENGGKVRVDKQVENEYKIGEKAPKSNVIVELSEDFSEVLNVKQLNEFNGENKSKKLLINPDLVLS